MIEDWFGRVIRLFIQCQEVFHALDVFLIQLRRAPHFPPWLEVVVLKKYPHGLSPGPRHELALDCFLGNQPHRPARVALGRITSHHGNDALLLAGPEQTSRP